MLSYRETDSALSRFPPSTETHATTPLHIAAGRKLIIDKSIGQDSHCNDHPLSYTAVENAYSHGEVLSRSHSLNDYTPHFGYPPLPCKAPNRPTAQRERRSTTSGQQRRFPNNDLDPSPRNAERHPSRRVEYMSINEAMEQDQTYDLQNGDPGPLFLTQPYDSTEYRNRFSDDTISISKQSMVSRGSSRLPDFFGPGIFQLVLHNPTTSHQLLKFSESCFCSENVEFLAEVEHYQSIVNDLAKTMATLHKKFISPEAAHQINIPDNTMKTVRLGMKTLARSTLPAMESLFSEVQEKIEQLVFTDIYPRFVRYQMAMSATRALATDRHKYQGLGDCFCLTNPSIADNPIVFASDGFVNVTGYQRPDIIPRNCRFLQGEHTDREPVQRLRNGIDRGQESVELLLNYKKNGEPFWNLLYVAPLFNAEGKIAFFIGGQINCSTTVHGNADMLRILSASTDLDNDQAEAARRPPTPTSPFSKKGFLKALGAKADTSKGTLVLPEAGMERGLLNRIEGRELGAQMKEFYTAYSKFLVVRYDSFIINFYSEGVTSMLNPANNSEGIVAGTDVFRFFRQNMVSSNGEYKSKVRNALRDGLPVSLSMRLQTRRSAMFRGDERFVTHWTPLKDEKALVHWVVVTLAPEIE